MDTSHKCALQSPAEKVGIQTSFPASGFFLKRLFSPELSFVSCGVAGFLSALTLSLFLVLHTQLSPWTMLICAATAVAGLLGTALTIKVLTGEDGFVFYRDAVTAIFLVALVLRLLHQPVLRYLDVTILGAGLFTAFGRIGCLLVGCCHGRPSRFGVRYGFAHVQTGFPEYLVGVRLFPIQVVESVYVFTLVAAGSVLLFRSPAPGSVLSFYVLAYACGRFCIEFVRGDVARPYYKSFSQAQWLSLFLATFIFCAGRFHLLPGSNWHRRAFFFLVSAMLIVHVYRRVDPSSRFSLTHPNHVREFAGILRKLNDSLQINPNDERTEAGSHSIPVTCTSAGLRLSAGKINLPGRRVRSFSLSCDSRPLSLSGVRRLSALISHFLFTTSQPRLVAGSLGVFHVLFSEGSASPQTEPRPLP